MTLVTPKYLLQIKLVVTLLVSGLSAPAVLAECPFASRGELATKAEGPDHAVYFYGKARKVKCNGTFVGDTFNKSIGNSGNKGWILTSAHCNLSKNDKIGFKDRTGKVRFVCVHPKFDSTTLDYDVALVETGAQSDLKGLYPTASSYEGAHRAYLFRKVKKRGSYNDQRKSEYCCCRSLRILGGCCGEDNDFVTRRCIHSNGHKMFKGDSGAAVLTMQAKIAGIVTRVDNKGRAGPVEVTDLTAIDRFDEWFVGVVAEGKRSWCHHDYEFLDDEVLAEGGIETR